MSRIVSGQNGQNRPLTVDERRVMTLRRIYTTYPRWMDKADYLQTREFKEIVKRAKELHKLKIHDLKWRVNCHGLFRQMDQLKIKILDGPGRDQSCQPLILTGS